MGVLAKVERPREHPQGPEPVVTAQPGPADNPHSRRWHSVHMWVCWLESRLANLGTSRTGLAYDGRRRSEARGAPFTCSTRRHPGSPAGPTLRGLRRRPAPLGCTGTASSRARRPSLPGERARRRRPPVGSRPSRRDSWTRWPGWPWAAVSGPGSRLPGGRAASRWPGGRRSPWRRRSCRRVAKVGQVVVTLSAQRR